MKIGVALSGGGIGGICAFRALARLEEWGFSPEMISVCGISSATALLYAAGAEAEDCEAQAARLLEGLRGGDPEPALQSLAEAAARRRGELPDVRTPIAVHCADLGSGKIYSFTDDYHLAGDRLETAPLNDLPTALAGTVSPGWGLAGTEHGGARLCDYSLWHGCPAYPLRMAGARKALALAFVPAVPGNTYEQAVSLRLRETSHLADMTVFLPVEDVQSLEEAEEQVLSALEGCREELYYRLL